MKRILITAAAALALIATPAFAKHDHSSDQTGNKASSGDSSSQDSDSGKKNHSKNKDSGKSSKGFGKSNAKSGGSNAMSGGSNFGQDKKHDKSNKSDKSDKTSNWGNNSTNAFINGNSNKNRDGDNRNGKNHDNDWTGKSHDNGRDKHRSGVNVFLNFNGFNGKHNHNNAWNSYRHTYHSKQRYRHGSYKKPHGWYSHSWTYGEFLPSIFFSQDYWIDDYDSFGLFDPPEGLTWIRYGDDALLVDEYTGEVVQVRYGLFY